ncbi:MAG TPA: hypothetical protein VNS52_11020, partial [Gemmatimonadaceae bacterium]|nr:hypothetical protein [Gemmatimonadaceae bacterium]
MIEWGRKIAAVAALALVGVVSGGAGAQQRTPPPSSSVDARVDALLKQMTLEEKVGEMTQLTIQAVAKTHGTAATTQTLDSAKLEDALVGHNVG